MPWFSDIAHHAFEVECEGRRHTVRWANGRIHLDDHEDADAERVLVALGGSTPGCLAMLDLWEQTVSDGGFIEEWWRHLDADHRRTWWLRTALERLRSEGIQDFLYDLPRNRAAQMCEASVTLPHAVLDRAAAAVVDRADASGWVLDRLLLGHIIEAVRLRARRAFVTSIQTNGTLHVGSAPLIPLRCNISVDAMPSAGGVLAGRRSNVVLDLHPSWLSRVWGRGVAIHQGLMTIDADETEGGVTLTQVEWVPDGAHATPRLVTTNFTGASRSPRDLPLPGPHLSD
jgi:hypothetical protein